MAAAKKVFKLSNHTRQGRLLPHHGLQLRRIFALPDSDAVRVLLPGSANVIAMAKQTFVAVNIFGNRFTDMIAAPRSRVVRRPSLLRPRTTRLRGAAIIS